MTETSSKPEKKGMPTWAKVALVFVAIGIVGSFLIPEETAEQKNKTFESKMRD